MTVLGVARLLHSHHAWTWAFASAHPLDGWAHWDGRWFLLIARSGYGAPGSQAFYPLYPVLMRVTARLVGTEKLGGVLVACACFVGAAYLLYRLVAEQFNPRIGIYSVVFLSIAPTSFFFQAVYNESLFLLLVVASFRLAQKRLWFPAGAVGLLACLTRASGVVLILPLAIQYMESRDWHWRRVRADALAVVLPLGGTGLYALYLARVFGDPLLMVHAERQWHRHLGNPLLTISRGVVDGTKGIVYLTTGHGFAAPAKHLGL